MTSTMDPSHHRQSIKLRVDHALVPQNAHPEDRQNDIDLDPNPDLQLLILPEEAIIADPGQALQDANLLSRNDNTF